MRLNFVSASSPVRKNMLVSNFCRIFVVVIVCISSRVSCEEKKSTTVFSVLNNYINSTTTEIPREKLSNSSSSDLQAKSSSYTAIPYENTPILTCPGPHDPIRPFVVIPCKNNKDCAKLGNKKLLCCKKRCTKGVLAPPPEPSHSPSWFGFVDRVCPAEFMPEILAITKCRSDSECGSRICCPEKMANGIVQGFCRTAQPKLDKVPAMKSLMEPMKLMMGYMQCSPPPPPIFDVFPKTCSNFLDCFPNLCCQERGRKICRPPKRSLLTLLTSVAQRVIPENAARNIITQLIP